MHVHIVTPSGVSFEGEVEKITVPGEQGQMTVLPHHANTITSLTSGKIIYTPIKNHTETALEQFSDHEKTISIPWGMCQIKDNTVEIIVS